MNWRIYRLPGSKQWWMIDHGQGSAVLFVKKWDCQPGLQVAGSDDYPEISPRSWIVVRDAWLWITDQHRAIFTLPKASVPV